MVNIKDYDVFNIHGMSWEEDEPQLTIRVSLHGQDVDEIVVNNDSISYTTYEDGHAVYPYYIDAPDILKNILSFATECCQYVFKYMLFSTVYPVLVNSLDFKQMSSHEAELSILSLASKISGLSLIRTRVAPSSNDAPIEKQYRLHLEERPRGVA